MDAIESFYPRGLSPVLADALLDTPVVCLLGPRQSGKTTLVQKAQPERTYVSLDTANYRQAAEDDPDGFVAGLPSFVTIDEIQHVPKLLPAIKRSVDVDRRPGRFLLTGSANLLLLPKVAESLAGRMEVLYLQPLTEAEKMAAPGAFLRAWFAGNLHPEVTGKPADSADLVARMMTGGYPEPVGRPPRRARQWHRQYVRSIIERDIQDVTRVREPRYMANLLELLALRTGTLLNVSGLSQELGIHRETVDHYLECLEKLFLIRRLPAWHRHPARRLVKTPKVHAVDSGLCSSLANLTAEDWIEQRDLMGHLLESFVIQQLIAQSAWTDPELHFSHYRDKDKVEVDLVVQRNRSIWGIEVKAGSTVRESDTMGLARLAHQCGSHFQSGIVLYVGRDVLPLGKSSFLAVPIQKLWEC